MEKKQTSMGKSMEKEKLLKKFPMESEFEVYFGGKPKQLSSEIVEIVKKSKPTYEEAYASLEMTYRALKYESNFVHVYK